MLEGEREGGVERAGEVALRRASGRAGCAVGRGTGDLDHEVAAAGELLEVVAGDIGVELEVLGHRAGGDAGVPGVAGEEVDLAPGGVAERVGDRADDGVELVRGEAAVRPRTYSTYADSGNLPGDPVWPVMAPSKPKSDRPWRPWRSPSCAVRSSSWAWCRAWRSTARPPWWRSPPPSPASRRGPRSAAGSSSRRGRGGGHRPGRRRRSATWNRRRGRRSARGCSRARRRPTRCRSSTRRPARSGDDHGHAPALEPVHRLPHPRARGVVGQGRGRQVVGHHQPRGGARGTAVTAVAAVDADVWGFSMPRMLGISAPPGLIDDVIVPPEANGVRLISMGFFAREDQAVIWRGPMLHKALEQFLTDVYWGELDYLVVDMPPGTGDVSLSIAQFLPRAEVIVVTTPQPAAQRVAQRAAAMAEKVDLQVIGVIENMSWFTGDDGKRYEIFGAHGGEELADELGVPLLGQIPLVPELPRRRRQRPADHGGRSRRRGRGRVPATSPSASTPTSPRAGSTTPSCASPESAASPGAPRLSSDEQVCGMSRSPCASARAPLPSESGRPGWRRRGIPPALRMLWCRYLPRREPADPRPAATGVVALLRRRPLHLDAGAARTAVGGGSERSYQWTAVRADRAVRPRHRHRRLPAVLAATRRLRQTGRAAGEPLRRRRLPRRLRDRTRLLQGQLRLGTSLYLRGRQGLPRSRRVGQQP